MAGSSAARKRNAPCQTKVKTGCATCRKRKVKCDENKPFCHKCVDTGRACDGYESPFRILTSQSVNITYAGNTKPGAALQPEQPPSAKITPRDIELLDRYFSVKTMFDVKLGCEEEARQVLLASLTDPAIRHAVSSLRALREDFERSRDIPANIPQQTPSADYGLQQYCMALGGLASSLWSPGSDGLRSALLCCQIFICIEQVRGNYAAMAQHLIQGLGIMHEHRARPRLAAADKLVPAHQGQLPLLDVFIIKLFSAPCKFAEPTEPVIAKDTGGATASVGLTSTLDEPLEAHESRKFCTIAPDMRTELTRIGALTLEFLDKVSRVESETDALRLLSDKTSLLDLLKSWLANLERVYKGMGPPSPEPIMVSFLRYFHRILKVILLGALDFSPDRDAELQVENDRLKDIASNVGERVKDYWTRGGTKSSQGIQSTVR